MARIRRPQREFRVDTTASKRAKEKLLDARWESYRRALENSPDFLSDQYSFSEDCVTINKKEGISADDQQQLNSSLKEFCPWKKGPFSFFDIDIDSEWQSQIKWDRIKPAIGSLEGQVIADIGCHNGYFMYRMLPDAPKEVVGFEPVPKHWYNFHLINKYLPENPLAFELFGVEHLDLFPNTFDTIFCMGILYHHTDPMSLLRKMKLALKKKGRIIIDCQGIPGDSQTALIPQSRYAGAKGIWFLPTLAGLQNWIRRAGLRSETIWAGPLLPEEQRSTEWADIKSLKDFLNDDMTQTIEGYPPPHRFYVIARN